MFYRVRPLHDPTLVEPVEADATRPWYRTRFWRVFSLSLTFTGFLFCFACAFYFLLFNRSEFIYFTVSAVICLMVFVHLVAGNCPFLNIPRPLSAVPVQIESGDRIREVLRRTESERGLSLVPERDHLFHSLPAYILIPAEPTDRDESSNASTESTLTAESAKRHEESELLANPQNQGVAKKPTANGPCVVAKLSDAAAVISQIVKGSILDNEENTSTTVQRSSGISSEEKGSEANIKGVRQRKVTPMEAQEYIRLKENLKA